MKLILWKDTFVFSIFGASNRHSSTKFSVSFFLRFIFDDFWTIWINARALCDILARHKSTKNEQMMRD